jgi:hypothetical protein
MRQHVTGATLLSHVQPRTRMAKLDASIQRPTNVACVRARCMKFSQTKQHDVQERRLHRGTRNVSGVRVRDERAHETAPVQQHAHGCMQGEPSGIDQAVA